MTIRRLEVDQGIDELGGLEEFSWDLFPVVDSSSTTRLEENGLPKKGPEP